MSDPKPPTLDYRPTPRPAEPVRWGKVVDKIAGVMIVVLLLGAFLGCVFYRFCLTIVGSW